MRFGCVDAARLLAGVLAVLCSACGGGSSEILQCSAITSAALGIPALKITSATQVAAKTDSALASGNYPAHCQVTGTLNERTGIDGKPYAIGFEIRLPDTWNGKFFYQGGGGTDGVLNPALGNLLNSSTSNALSQGYAVAASDGGHNTGQSDVGFGVDPQARLDYGYNSVGALTPVAKTVVLRRYGSAPQHSYFVGCSNGGREALVTASRYPDYFDGLVAASPGLDLPKAAVAQQWSTQKFMTAAAPGQLPKDVFPPAATSLVASKLLAKCDALDGAVDGMVNNLSACRSAFNINTDVPTCTGAFDGTCLTSAQKSALTQVMAGPSNSQAQALYASFPWDAGMAGAGWRFWMLDAGFAPFPFNTLIGAGAMGYVFSSPPDQPSLADAGFGYQMGFNFDTDAPKIFAKNATYTQSAMEFMNPTDMTLAAYRARGGKLIVYHGSADPVFSADRSVQWYQSMLAADGNAANQSRLYLVPGMNHCSGGPAAERFSMLPVLDAWAGGGAQPDSVTAGINPADPDVAARGWPAQRTRPLCPYPKQAKLKTGATDLESAASFVCE